MASDAEFWQNADDWKLVRQNLQRLGKLVSVARRENRSDFLRRLTAGLREGRVFFPEARDSVEVDATEGVYFCAFLNAVFESGADDPDERSLRDSAAFLLLLIAERAIVSSWLRLASAKTMLAISAWRPLPFGTEYQLALLVLTWVEWHRGDFACPSDQVVEMLTNLFAVTIDRAYLSTLTEELANARSPDASDLAGALASLRLGGGGGGVGEEAETKFLARAWRQSVAERSHGPPPPNAFTPSSLHVQNQRLYEFHPNFGRFRLIALPPPEFEDVYFCLDGQKVLALDKRTGSICAADLSSVAAPDTPQTNFCRRRPYPEHAWTRFRGKHPLQRPNVIGFSRKGNDSVVLSIDADDTSRWIVVWLNASFEKRWTLRAPVCPRGDPLRLSVHATLVGSLLRITDVREGGENMLVGKREYILDLASESVREGERLKTIDKSYVENGPSDAECRRAWASGNPVVLPALENSPEPICLGNVALPSSREGFWVSCAHKIPESPLERLYPALNWRKTGRFNR